MLANFEMAFLDVSCFLKVAQSKTYILKITSIYQLNKRE